MYYADKTLQTLKCTFHSRNITFSLCVVSNARCVLSQCNTLFRLLYVLNKFSDMSAAQWEELLENNNWNNVSLRDARYDQVIHLVSEKSFINQFAFTNM